MTMVDQCCNLANRRLADYIPPTKFRSRTLILDRNLLTNIRNVKYCSSLYQLSVCHNKIQDMSPVASLQKLKLLHLIDNVISNISGVGDCSDLEELNMSRNCLQGFSELQHCMSLTKVDLSYNSISQLSDISSLTSLKELYLHGNEIHTLESAPLCLPTNLQVLSLADNKISDIGQLAYLTRLKQLECLSLAGNDCASSNTRPYQVFIVMCCPSIRYVDEDVITAEHREHARRLENKMMMSGDSSFCGLRDDRPRRPRSKTDVSSNVSKGNVSYAANSAITRDKMSSRDSCHSNDTSPSSTFSAYEEYDDRPAASGAPRIRPRRGSGQVTPPPEVGRGRDRPRAQSLFVSSPPPRVDEEEMECESVYVGVSDDVSMCLSASPRSLASSSHHVWSRDSTTTQDSNGTMVSSSRHQVASSNKETPGHDSSQKSCPSNGTVSSGVMVGQKSCLRSSSAAFFVPLNEEQAKETPCDLEKFSASDVARVVKIQAAWRGHLTRKKGLLNDMCLRRYQSHFTAMSEQISQLSAALNKERELCTLYRYMIADLCKKVGNNYAFGTEKSRSFERSTQAEVCLSENASQTDGLVNTLISSLCLLPPAVAKEDAASGIAIVGNGTGVSNCEGSFVEDSGAHAVDRNLEGNEKTALSEPEFLKVEGDYKVDELKKRFESPDHHFELRGSTVSQVNDDTEPSSICSQDTSDPNSEIIPPNSPTENVVIAAAESISSHLLTPHKPDPHAGDATPSDEGACFMTPPITHPAMSSPLTVAMVKDTISLMRSSLQSPRLGVGGLENFKPVDELVNE